MAHKKKSHMGKSTSKMMDKHIKEEKKDMKADKHLLKEDMKMKKMIKKRGC